MALFTINLRSCWEREDENYCLGTSLVVQWLRLQAPKAEGLGLIPVWGTKISHATIKVSNAETKDSACHN